MSNLSFLQELEEDPFDPEEFVERLAWRTAGGYGDGETFDPRVLHSAFEAAICELQGLHESTQKKCERMEIICHDQEKRYWQQMALLLDRNKEAFTIFRELDERIDYVATKVVHLGDQLESVNIPRSRAVEAQKLMQNFAEFLDKRTPNQGLFADPDKLFEAADIILKLHLISQELPSGKFEQAQKNIFIKYDEIEKHLIEEFVSSQAQNDIDRMKEVAEILSHFKDYFQCINAFIDECQRELEINLNNIFETVVPLCQRSQPVIEKVFGNPEQVMAKFVQKIFEKHLKDYSTDKLGDKSNPDLYLRNLYDLYSRTVKLCGELSSFRLGTDCPQFLSRLTRSLYARHLDTYVSLEVQSLKDKCTLILDKYYQARKHMRKQINTGGIHELGRDLRAKLGSGPENYGGETFLSEEVAINLLQESKLALQRCQLLSRQSDLPTNAAQIFDILLHFLCTEHIDYALELGLQGIPHPEIKVAPEIHFFTIVYQCNSIFHLLEKKFIDTVVPLVISTPRHGYCLHKKKVTMSQMELKLHNGLERSIGTLIGWIKTLLKHQRPTDFKCEPSSANMVPEATKACEYMVIFLNNMVLKLRDTLDGKNVEAVLTELGVRFHRTIYDHLLQYHYTSYGATIVMCDVNEYRRCTKEFRVPLVNNLFDTLYALCNLLLVRSDNLKQMCSGDQLAGLDPAVLMKFVQLRIDFKTENLASQFR